MGRLVRRHRRARCLSQRKHADEPWQRHRFSLRAAGLSPSLEGDAVKPTKPKTDNFPRVYRGGGGWGGGSAARARAALRFTDAPADRYYSLGFRLTQTGCQQILKGVTPP